MRVSTTAIEQYRLWTAEDWMPEQDVIDCIRGVYKPKPEMIAGQAFHAILEDPAAHRIEGGYKVEGVFFADVVANPCLEVIDRRGVFEVKQSKPYQVGRESVTVVAKADLLVGTTVVENKTRWSTFDVDKYQDSCQWRFYADIFRPTRVTYNVFLLSQRADGTIEFRGVETFSLYPYADLARDCRELLDRFVGYVNTRGLRGYLADKPLSFMEAS